MNEKEESRERAVAVRRILMSEWDPIGVSDIPEAADEYDGYVSGVCDLLARNANDWEIAAYLREIETVRMGLTDSHGEPLLAAKRRDGAVAALQRRGSRQGQA